MPRIIDHDRRRSELLRASFPLFAQLGYANVTMRVLALQLGVSTGTLYHYFDNKAALFGAMVQRLTAETVEVAARGIAPDADVDVRLAALGRFLEAEAHTLQQTLLICLEFQRHHPEPSAQTLLSDTLGDYAEALAEQLGIEDEAVARALLSFLLGALIHRVLDPGAVDLQQHVALVGVVAAGLGPEALRRPAGRTR
jgi:AcrR family transcriptional regulator